MIILELGLQQRLKFDLQTFAMKTFAVKTFEAFEPLHCSKSFLEGMLHYTVEVQKSGESSLLHFHIGFRFLFCNAVDPLSVNDHASS